MDIKKVYDIIENNREEMISSLRELISIPSYAGEKKENAPFGEDVDKAYRYMLSKGEEEGFSTFDADGYGGHIQFHGKSGRVMGILGHLDVVPEGKDWDFPPYEGVISDGKMYGRGTIDDKGPVISCFYAMKALKEAGFEPETSIRMILGLDEEANWYGMDYYLSKTKAPDFGFTPDGEFPAIHGEKGIIVFDIAGKFSKSQGKGLRLRAVKGGNAANMVADYARAVVLSDDREDYEKVKEIITSLKEEKKYRITAKQVGKSLEIVAHGISAHGARPHQGLNAISVMMELLGKLPVENDDAGSFIDFYNRHIGFETDGTSIGAGLCDEPSGNLVLNVGLIDMSEKSAVLTVNVRYPVTKTAEDVYDALAPVMTEYNLGICKGKNQLPIYLPENHPMIETLMNVYREHTGDCENPPMVIGGGTYARAVENTVAFGPSLPGDRELAHQKNEYIEIDHLVMVTKLYADAIARLTGEK